MSSPLGSPPDRAGHDHEIVRASLVRLELFGFDEAAESVPNSALEIILRSFEAMTLNAFTRMSGAMVPGVAPELTGLFRGENHALSAVRATIGLLDQWHSRSREKVEGRLRITVAAAIHTDAILLLNNGSVAGRGAQALRSISRAATGGMIVASQKTLNAILASLPSGWRAEHLREEGDVTPSQMVVGLLPVSPELENGVVRIYDSAEAVEPAIAFRYVAEFKARPLAPPLPVLTITGTTHEIRMPDALSIAGSETETAGRFELLRKIGSGGMGEVWLARDSFGNSLAVKRISGSEVSNAADTLRFQREADILSRLSHRNIVRIVELGESGGAGFLVMEYVDGVTLAELVALGRRQSPSLAGLVAEAKHGRPAPVAQLSGGMLQLQTQRSELDDAASEPKAGSSSLSFAQSVDIMLKLCDAIQFAHDWRVLHRDLKPQNVMIRSDGEPIVMDFGLAKQRRENGAGVSLSLDGTLLGTLEYMAPEQAEDNRLVTEKSDIYSLGGILYFMLTGDRPFRSSGSLTEDLRALSDHVPASLRSIRGDIPRDLEVITSKCLMRLPEHRYASASQLADDLRRFRDGLPIVARPPEFTYLAGRWIRRHRGLVNACVAAVCMLLICSLIFGINVIRERDRSEAALSELRRTAPMFYTQAQALVRESRLDAALEKMDSAVGLDNENAEYRGFRANLLQANQSLGAAVAEYEAALRCPGAEKVPNLAKNLSVSRELLSQSNGQPLSKEGRGKLVDVLLSQGRTLEAAPLVLSLKKDNVAVEQVVRARLGEWMNRPRWRPDRLAMLANGTFSLDLSFMDISRLAPLRGLPISELRIDHTECVDLLDLRDLPLVKLNADSTGVNDLGPLRALRLRWLRVSSSQVRDLSPLAGHPLEHLDLAGCPLSGDLSPLKGAPLSTLFLTSTGIENVAALDGLPLLSLSLAATKVYDVSVVRTMPLRTLDLSSLRSPIDLLPIVGLDTLETLKLPEHPLNLRSLQKLVALRQIGWTQRGMYEPVEFWRRFGPGLDPNHPAFRALKEAGVNPVNHARIETLPDGSLHLFLRDAPISDLGFLKGLSVSSLDVSHTAVSDLRPAASAALREIDCRWTKMKDAAVLLGCPNLRKAVLPSGVANANRLWELPKMESVQIADETAAPAK